MQAPLFTGLLEPDGSLTRRSPEISPHLGAHHGESLFPSLSLPDALGLDIETTPADNIADLLRVVPGLNVSQISARNVCPQQAKGQETDESQL